MPSRYFSLVLVMVLVGCRSDRIHSKVEAGDLYNGNLRLWVTREVASKDASMFSGGGYWLDSISAYEITYDLSAAGQDSLAPTVHCVGNVNESINELALGVPVFSRVETVGEDVRKRLESFGLVVDRCTVKTTPTGDILVIANHGWRHPELENQDAPVTQVSPRVAAVADSLDVLHRKIFVIDIASVGEIWGFPEKITIWDNVENRIQTLRLIEPTFPK